MTPQLQQAIRLLQLSSMELQVEIQEALETNMMLETAEEAATEQQDKEKPEDNIQTAEVNLDSTQEMAAPVEPENIPDELDVDCVWEDTYESSVNESISNVSRNFEGAQFNYENQ